MPDGGLVYCETDMSRAIVEPWTTATELAFLALALVWAWRLRGRYREHLYVSLTLPVIFVGFVGGVLYHGLRSHRAFFLMDVIPILVLAVGTLGYLAWRVWRRTWVAVLYPAAVVGLIAGILQVSENVTAFAFIYSLIALAIAGPVVVDFRRLPSGRREARRKRDEAVAAGDIPPDSYLIVGSAFQERISP